MSQTRTIRGTSPCVFSPLHFRARLTPLSAQNVPVEATLQGRVPGVGRSSRFRTGRLESAQMIIPSLLAQHVREDGQDSEDEDDGLTPEERENIRKTLEMLAGRTDDGGPATLDGRRIVPALSGSISQMLAATPEGKVVRAKAPPVVKAAGVPIAVPANPTPEVREEPLAPLEGPKKMSRCVLSYDLPRRRADDLFSTGSRRDSWDWSPRCNPASPPGARRSSSLRLRVLGCEISTTFCSRTCTEVTKLWLRKESKGASGQAVV